MSPIMLRCFQVNVRDNVATMLDDGTGIAEVLGQSRLQVHLLERIEPGHKVALGEVRAGEPVVKFGVVIGRATRDIRAGQWVHLHNCASDFDKRSQTLNLHSGTTTDTRYE